MQTDGRRNGLPLYHDSKRSVRDRSPVFCVDKTGPDGRTLRIGIGTTRYVACDFSVFQHRFVVMEQGAGILQFDVTQEWAFAVSLANTKGFTPDKRDSLFGLTDKPRPT